jgi:hypothetical protein
MGSIVTLQHSASGKSLAFRKPISPFEKFVCTVELRLSVYVLSVSKPSFDYLCIMEKDAKLTDILHIRRIKTEIKQNLFNRKKQMKVTDYFGAK